MSRQVIEKPGVLFLFLAASITGAYGRICKESYSYQDAKGCCMEAGSSVMPVYNTTDKLVAEMTKANILSAWLSIERRTLGKYVWLNDQIANNTALTKNIYSNRSCGIFDNHNTEVTAEHCSKSVGHICEMQGCTDCNTLGWDSMVCQQAKNSCFIFSCDNTNWYDARLSCERKGHRLAVVSPKTTETAISGTEYACNRFWVGVRSEKWVQSSDNIQPVVSFWDVRQPSDTGNCTAMFIAGTSYQMKVQPCSQRRHVICRHGYSQIAATSGAPAGGNTVMIISVLVVVAVVGLLLFALLVIFRKRLCKQVNKNNKSEVNKDIPEERNQLVKHDPQGENKMKVSSEEKTTLTLNNKQKEKEQMGEQEEEMPGKKEDYTKEDTKEELSSETVDREPLSPVSMTKLRFEINSTGRPEQQGPCIKSP